MSNQSTSEIQAAIAARVARRDKMKAAYQRLNNNPFRVNHNFIDPMLFRFDAARAYARDYYKFTPRSTWFPISFVASIVFFQMYLNKERSDTHQSILNGEKTYYERALWSVRYIF
jgi:hypothetical protein